MKLKITYKILYIGVLKILFICPALKDNFITIVIASEPVNKTTSIIFILKPFDVHTNTLTC